jgi:sulfur-oxidizing protein SoxY
VTENETTPPSPTSSLGRRTVLAGAGALAVTACAAPALAQAQAGGEFAQALKKAVGAATPQPGKVAIAAPEIADNGATVAVTFSVDHPITPASFVRRITVLADGNPNPEVAVFAFSPRSGKAEVATRVRLAKTQSLVALAELSDGAVYMAKREIRVTIGGCGG